MTPIPNSFSTPNDYIDASMEFLTSEEFKCLMFATRHLLGWQGSFSGQPKAMSLSMFEHGYTAANGTVYGGTGLSRGAIIRATDALNGFGLLVKAGKATAGGQAWQLGEAPDFEAMAARKEAQKAKAAERTAKARQAKASAGKSDKPALASQSDRPAAVSATDRQRLVGQTQLNPSLNPTQIQDGDDDARARESLAELCSDLPDEDPDAPNIYRLYHATFGKMVDTPRLMEEFKDMAATYPSDWWPVAFDAAALAGTHHPNYIRAVLESRRVNGTFDKPRPERPATPKGSGPLPRATNRVSTLPPLAANPAPPPWLNAPAKAGAS